MTALVTIEAVVLALLCVLVAGLLRSHAAILRRLHQLGIDTSDLVRPDAARPPPSPAEAPEVAAPTPVPRPSNDDG